MRSSIRLLACSVVLTCVTSTAAYGDDATPPPEDTGAFVKKLAANAFTRARRSITVGPMVGMAAGAGAVDGEFDSQLTFGISLLRYDIPFAPTGARLREMATSRFRKEMARRLAERSTGLSDDDKKRIAREVWADIKAELLLEMRPRRFEKPKFGLRLEAARLADSGIWDIRPMLGVGVGPVQVWAGPSVRIEDGAGFVIPLEVSKPIMLTKGLRSPVVEAFVRAEFAVTRRDDFADVVVVGARFTLDVI